MNVNINRIILPTRNKMQPILLVESPYVALRCRDDEQIMLGRPTPR